MIYFYMFLNREFYMDENGVQCSVHYISSIAIYVLNIIIIKKYEGFDYREIVNLGICLSRDSKF